MKKQQIADFSLVMVTLAWGTSFLLTKNSISSLAVYNFLALRFFIASFIAAIIFRKRLFLAEKSTYYSGVITGLMLFASFAFQTTGLRYTSVSNSAFITGISVILVPIFSSLFLKKKIKTESKAGVTLALIGLAFLTLRVNSLPNIGDVYTLICAVLFAIYILMVEKYTDKSDPVAFAIIQLFTVAVLGFVTSVSLEGFTISGIELGVWINILLLALICTDFAFITQNIAQKYTTATHTALIFSLEPVFATIFGYFLANDIIDTRKMIGIILIFSGIILSEIDFKKLVGAGELSGGH